MFRVVPGGLQIVYYLGLGSCPHMTLQPPLLDFFLRCWLTYVELIGEDESDEEEPVVKWLADARGVYVLSTTFNIRYIYYKNKYNW